MDADGARRILALDIGGVCVALHPERCARGLGFASLAALGDARPELSRQWLDMETGTLSDGAFFNAVAKAVPVEIDAEAVKELWCAMIGEELPGLGEVIDRLREAVITPVFFSDTSRTHEDYIREHLSFAEHVRGQIVSYEVGALKPDAAMFRAMEQRFCGNGVPWLYVDDKASNIAAGQARGWPGHVFRTVEGLRRAVDECLAATDSPVRAISRRKA